MNLLFNTNKRISIIIINSIPGISEDDRAGLLEFRRVWFSAAGIQLTRRRASAYTDYLRRLKDKRMGVTATPSRAEREKIIADAAVKLRTCGDIAAPL